jgi:serine protease Do
MEKIKINFFKKFSISKNIISYFLTSLLSTVIILAIGLGFVWNFRVNIFNYFAKEYFKEMQNPNNNLGNENAGNVAGNQPLFSQESLVINAVKKTNPAVVSIIISKNVPKYEEYTDPNQPQNPFGDLFPGFTFNIPQYRQDGTENQEIGGGSGFLVSSSGLIVTNKHVVDQGDVEYTVFTNDGKKHTATVVARDPVLDIALIKINPTAGENFPYLTLGDSDSLQVGQSVIAIGNALAEYGNTESLDHVIQTDAAINPGNSGGPLLDLSGDVIGVNVAIAENSQNIGFALPINSVKSAIQSVEATGKIIRPYLGIRYVPIDSAMKEANNLSVDYGALVKGGQDPSELAVIPGGPADKAGIVENDIILQVDGVKIDDTNSLASVIAEKNVGEVITMQILHKGAQKTVQVTLEAAPSS